MDNKTKRNSLHVYSCAIIAVISTILSFKFLHTSIILSMTLGFLTGLSAGLLKEFIWDKLMKKGTFSWMAIFYDFWGAFFGCLIVGGILNTIYN